MPVELTTPAEVTIEVVPTPATVTVEVKPIAEATVTINPAGLPGMTAYDIAIANGFVGTEAEWLASLVGADGAQGIAGVGVPAGGTVGQALVKNSDTDYDTTWATPITEEVDPVFTASEAAKITETNYDWLNGQTSVFQTNGSIIIDKTTLDGAGNPAWLDLITHSGNGKVPSVKIDSNAFEDGDVLRLLKTDGSSFTIILGVAQLITDETLAFITDYDDIVPGAYGYYYNTTDNQYYLYSNAPGGAVELLKNGNRWSIKQSCLNFLPGSLAWSKVDKTGASPSDIGAIGASDLNGFLKYTGDWISSSTYTINDVVNSGGFYYICKVENTNIEPPDSDYWKLFQQQQTSPNWGEINGDIINQTDLSNALGAKLENETDPIFTAWDKDYADLSNKPDLSSLHAPHSDDQILLYDYAYNFPATGINGYFYVDKSTNTIYRSDGQTGSYIQLNNMSSFFLTQNRDYYVDPVNGNDANDGSSSSPFRHIMTAIGAMPRNLNGHTGRIYLQAGNFDDNSIPLDGPYAFQVSNFSNGVLQILGNSGNTYPNGVTLRTKGFYLSENTASIVLDNIDFNQQGTIDVGIQSNHNWNLKIQNCRFVDTSGDPKKIGIQSLNDHYLVINAFDINSSKVAIGLDITGSIINKSMNLPGDIKIVSHGHQEI